MTKAAAQDAVQLLKRYTTKTSIGTLPGFQAIVAAFYKDGGVRTFYDFAAVLDHCEVQRLRRKIAHGCADFSCQECD